MDDGVADLIDLNGSLRDRVRRLKKALELPLLFHASGRPNKERWKEITGTDEMTTKVMCDHIRRLGVHIG